MVIALDKTWVKILFTLWPIIVVTLSLLFLNELPWSIAFIAVAPIWWYAFIRKI